MKSIGWLALVVVGAVGCRSSESQDKPPASPSAAAPASTAPPPKLPDASDHKTAEPTVAMPGAPAMPGAEPATTRTDAEYRGDVQKICDVVQLSGAAGHDNTDKQFLVATWLGKNLATPDARKWLASIQRLSGNAKADALELEARRVGLDGCALASEWRSPASR